MGGAQLPQQHAGLEALYGTQFQQPTAGHSQVIEHRVQHTTARARCNLAFTSDFDAEWVAAGHRQYERSGAAAEWHAQCGMPRVSVAARHLLLLAACCSPAAAHNLCPLALLGPAALCPRVAAVVVVPRCFVSGSVPLQTVIEGRAMQDQALPPLPPSPRRYACTSQYGAFKGGYVNIAAAAAAAVGMNCGKHLPQHVL